MYKPHKYINREVSFSIGSSTLPQNSAQISFAELLPDHIQMG